MGIYESFPIHYKYYGFRVYKLQANSPLSPAGVKELEDFLIPPKELFEMKVPFYEWVKLNKGKEVSLEVYSLLKRALRTCRIRIGSEGGIGASVRYENWFNAAKNVLHVLKIKEHSWAEMQLSLKPSEDYFIACRPSSKDIVSLNQEDQLPFDVFEKVIKDSLGKECEFFIYNSKQGAVTQRARIDNNKHFELGCDVAYGKIHEFPQADEEDNDDGSSDQSIDEKKPLPLSNKLNSSSVL